MGSPDGTSPIPVRPAVGCWAAAWLIGSGVVASLAVALMGGELDGDLSIPELTVAAVVGWAAFVLGTWIVSRRYGSGSMRADYAISARPIDLLGVPLGVAGQLLLVPALYVPLRWVWPDTFDAERLEERARDLADRAEGGAVVLLVLVVVVGAPIVEELVYRGLVQRSLSRTTGAASGLLLASILFSLIHFSPVEYPGLFVAGLVFGLGTAVTGRLGPAIVTHAAFNAAGLVMVLWL